MPRVKRDECYTPKELVKAFTDVLGKPVLDPCTTPEANTVVGAERIYTKEDNLNPLEQDWPTTGFIWVNPPFSKPKPWIVKAVVQAAKQEADGLHIAVLTSNDTSTWWAQLAMQNASGMIMLQGRTQFWGPDVRGTSNRSGHMISLISSLPVRSDLEVALERSLINQGYGCTILFS